MQEQVCPRCQRGRVALFAVRGTSEHVWVCDECEATWRGGDLASTEFEQLQSFMAGSEAESAWEDLDPIDPEDPEV